MLSLLSVSELLCSILISGLIDIRTDSGTVTVDYADGPVSMYVHTKDERTAEFTFSSGANGVTVSSGQHEIHLPIDVKHLKFENQKLEIVTNGGRTIRVTYHAQNANLKRDVATETPPEHNGAPLGNPIKDQVKLLRPPNHDYRFADFDAAVRALAELDPLDSYAVSEPVLLDLARNLPPKALRSRQQESVLLKATEQMLISLIEQSRSDRSRTETRVLAASGEDPLYADVVSATVTPATLAIDVLRMIGTDSPRVRSLLKEELQKALNVLPQDDGAFGWSGWKYSIIENMGDGDAGQLGVLAAVAVADKKVATAALTHLNVVLHTWEDLTGSPMIFHNSSSVAASHLYDNLVITHPIDPVKYRYLPRVTTFDRQTFDTWISQAVHGAKSPAEFQRQMSALKAGLEHPEWKTPCAEVRTAIIDRTLREFDLSENWYAQMRAILAPGVTEREAQRVVDLIRGQPMKSQAAILANVVARWRPLYARPDQAPADGSDAETLLRTDVEILESSFQTIESESTGYRMNPDLGPLATLIHEDIDRFDSLPENYQDALMTILRSRQGLPKAHQFLRSIAAREDHPRCLEASLALLGTSYSNDAFRMSVPAALMKAMVERTSENQWLSAAASIVTVQGYNYSEETALRLAELVVADTKSGDIRPLRVRAPEPVAPNFPHQIPEDFVANSYRDVVISRRIILAASMARTFPESPEVRDRIALALARALPPEMLDDQSHIGQSAIPEELLFRLASPDFRITSSVAAPEDMETEKSTAHQAFELAMQRLLQASNWRTRLKELQSENTEPTIDAQFR